MDNQLLPCPFCAGEAQITIGNGGFDGRVQVECSLCRVGTFYYDEATAIRTWNRRAQAEPAQQPGQMLTVDQMESLIAEQAKRIFELENAPAQQPASKPEVVDHAFILRAAKEAGFSISGGFVMPAHSGHITIEIERFASIIRRDTEKEASEPAQPTEQFFPVYDTEGTILYYVKTREQWEAAKRVMKDGAAQPVAWRYREYDAEEQAHSEVWLLTRDKFVIDVARRYNAIIEGLYASPPNLRAAVEAMREAAAKVCDEYPQRDPAEDGNGYWAADECAKAIRSLDIDTVIAPVKDK